MISEAVIGQNPDIDGSAEPLIPTGPETLVAYGTYIRALSTNGAETVFVGLDNTVTTGTGYPLPAGEELFIPRAVAPNAGAIHVIGSAANLAAGYLAY